MAIAPDTTRPVLDRDLPQTSMVTPAEDVRTVTLNQVSWGAVFAGAVAALIAQVKLQAQQAADATARTVSQGALFGALALIFGALAAFFAGRGSAVDPTLTRTAPTNLTPRRA